MSCLVINSIERRGGQIDFNVSQRNPPLQLDVRGKHSPLIISATQKNSSLQLNVKREHSPLTISTIQIKSKLNASFSVICSVDRVAVIRFEKSKLSWSEKESTIGSTKYNILFSNRAWALEEVVIEELL